ncbi:MAG: binding-protein-dependent transport system inner rane component [Actinotalea sp.]|nr:binding-protein-dependent transport system inner rane component [Actinotalea sp.]
MSASTLAPSVRRRVSISRRRRRVGLILTLPALLFVAVFFFVPLGVMAWMSLNEWPLVGQAEFVGFANYTALLRDPGFRGAVLVSLVFVLVVTPLVVLLGLGLALLVKSPRRGVDAFRSIYFVPLVIGFAPAAYIWLWMLNPDVGVVNRLLLDTGLAQTSIQWLANTGTALLSAATLFIWKTVGFSMLLLMGGMQGVPQEVREAAMMDGAGRWRTFVWVTLPMMRRTVALVLVFSTVGAFLVFEPFFILTRGGPGSSTTGVVQWIFGTSFFNFHLGYGAAASFVLLALLLFFTTFQLRAMKEET